MQQDIAHKKNEAHFAPNDINIVI